MQRGGYIKVQLSEEMQVSMAVPKGTAVLLLVLGVAMMIRMDRSACQVMKGKVSCLDCKPEYDLSGIVVSVKCGKVRKVAVTKGDGRWFEREVAPDTECEASIVGGPKQLYAHRDSMLVNISSNAYSKPLSFYTSRPSALPKTTLIDLPLPREWGLAPSSYYFPYIFPIIGIP